MNNGTQVNISFAANPRLATAYDKIVVKMHLQKQHQNDSVFLVCGTDPKVGATTSSVFLARGLAQSGKSVLLLDGDMRKGWNAGEDKGVATLSEYLAGRISMEKIIYGTSVERMDIIPGGTAASPVQLLCSDNMKNLIDAVKSQYDFVIIDIPSAGAASDSNAVIGLVDQVILVASPERSYKKQIIECFETYKKYGASLLGVIVNRVDKYGYHDYVKNDNYYVGNKEKELRVIGRLFGRKKK